MTASYELAHGCRFGPNAEVPMSLQGTLRRSLIRVRSLLLQSLHRSRHEVTLEFAMTKGEVDGRNALASRARPSGTRLADHRRNRLFEDPIAESDDRGEVLLIDRIGEEIALASLDDRRKQRDKLTGCKLWVRKEAWRDGDAESRNRRLEDHGELLKGEALLGADPAELVCREPIGPGIGTGAVNEKRRAAQIFGLAERERLDQGRRGQRDDLAGGETMQDDARPDRF